MQRYDRHSCDTIGVNEVERLAFGCLSCEFKNLNFSFNSCHVNQSHACFSDDVMSGNTTGHQSGTGFFFTQIFFEKSQSEVFCTDLYLKVSVEGTTESEN